MVVPFRYIRIRSRLSLGLRAGEYLKNTFQFYSNSLPGDCHVASLLAMTVTMYRYALFYNVIIVNTGVANLPTAARRSPTCPQRLAVGR